MVVAAIVGITVAQSSLRPVRGKLSSAVEQITATTELMPIEINATGDLARLAESFNQMLRSLNSSRGGRPGWSPTPGTSCGRR